MNSPLTPTWNVLSTHLLVPWRSIVVTTERGSVVKIAVPFAALAVAVSFLVVVFLGLAVLVVVVWVGFFFLPGAVPTGVVVVAGGVTPGTTLIGAVLVGVVQCVG